MIKDSGGIIQERSELLHDAIGGLVGQWFESGSWWSSFGSAAAEFCSTPHGQHHHPQWIPLFENLAARYFKLNQLAHEFLKALDNVVLLS